MIKRHLRNIFRTPRSPAASTRHVTSGEVGCYLQCWIPRNSQTGALHSSSKSWIPHNTMPSIIGHNQILTEPGTDSPTSGASFVSTSGRNGYRSQVVTTLVELLSPSFKRVHAATSWEQPKSCKCYDCWILNVLITSLQHQHGTNLLPYSRKVLPNTKPRKEVIANLIGLFPFSSSFNMVLNLPKEATRLF